LNKIVRNIFKLIPLLALAFISHKLAVNLHYVFTAYGLDLTHGKDFYYLLDGFRIDGHNSFKILEFLNCKV